MIDDPNLHRSRYGTLDFTEIARVAHEVPLHAAIATIPLDAWHADRRAVETFRGAPSALSLLVHGNNHVSRELARPLSDGDAVAQLAQALARISRLERKTGLRVSRTMAAPHGACSRPTIRRLARVGFRALTISRPRPWADDDVDTTPDSVEALSGARPVEIVDGLPLVLRTHVDRLDHLPFAAFLRQPLVVYGHHWDWPAGADDLARTAEEVARVSDVRWVGMDDVLGDGARVAYSGSVAEITLDARAGRIELPDGVDFASVDSSGLDAHDALIVERSTHRARRRVPVLHRRRPDVRARCAGRAPARLGRTSADVSLAGRPPPADRVAGSPAETDGYAAHPLARRRSRQRPATSIAVQPRAGGVQVMSDTEPEQQHEPELPGPRSRTRASAGIFFRTSSGVLTLLIGFFGNLVLARLLTPKDFGIIAIGATVDARRLCAGRRRARERPHPSRRSTDARRAAHSLGHPARVHASDLGAGSPPRGAFGTAGLVTAIMLCSVPLSAFQAPGRVILNRRLLYSRVAMVELAASGTYYLWAIVGAALGYGVWAMATATVARAVVASAAFAIGSPFGFMIPTLHRAREFGEIVRFGLKFQSGWITVVVREQILNATTAIIGGVSTLGLWSLARRLIELPTTLVDSINTVTFPTMSHLLFREDDPRPLIEKTTRYSAITLAVFLSAFAASSIGLVPFAFGDQWTEAAGRSRRPAWGWRSPLRRAPERRATSSHPAFRAAMYGSPSSTAPSGL